MDDPLEIGTFDLFAEEVQTVVIELYQAALAGISTLDAKTKQGFCAVEWSHPDEESQELEFWANQVAMLHYHAGNLALVSLIMLFEQWLMGMARVLNTPQADGTAKRFQHVEVVLGSGPLSVSRLQDILIARNAIVHHAGATEYDYHGRKQVQDEIGRAHV